jgi:3-phosphoshikimate 1-carboxyvinyltransferase
MLLSLSEGEARITGFLASSDCLATLNALRAMGVQIGQTSRSELIVQGVGLNGLSEPHDVIDCGNSGTLVRLILGILAGQRFAAFLTGDQSLRSRPMGRVVRPLREMGALIVGRGGDALLPVAIRGGSLVSISFAPEIPSAQVKSCVLLAGILANGITAVSETRRTRDHTERMLEYLGAKIRSSQGRIDVEGRIPLIAKDIAIPGDISSAAFALCTAAASPGSRLTVRGVGVNPTRTGVLRVLQRMGARVIVEKRWSANNEGVADLTVVGAELRSVDIGPLEIPDVIDEIPILALTATQCTGVTTIRGAAELRVKESDRLYAIENLLTALGADVAVHGHDLRITGRSRLRPCVVDSCGDHRIAMTAAMAASFLDGEINVTGVDCIETSFPDFQGFLSELAGPGSVESFVLN